LILLASLASAPAMAHETEAGHRKEFDAPALTSRWQVFAGGNLSTFSTDASFASALGPIGIVIRLEDDLGLEQEVDTFLVGFRYRLKRHQSLEVSFTDLKRNSSRVIQKDIDFGDVVFKAGGRIDTRFNTSLLKAKWKYDFSDSGRLDAGLSLGLSTFNIELGLRGAGIVQEEGEPPRPEEFADEGAEFIAPVPVIGFYLDYAFSPNWTIRLGADAIELSVSGNRGRVVESAFTFEYYFTRLFGLGFGLGNQTVEYTKDEDGQRFRVEYRVQNFAIYLSFVF
jgi:hypothetical protein